MRLNCRETSMRVVSREDGREGGIMACFCWTVNFEL